MVFGYVHPRQSMQQLRDELDRLVSNFLSESSHVSSPPKGSPAVNAWETPDGVFVELEVPGVKSDQLDIAIVGGELMLRIERPDMHQPNVTYHRRERPVGSFSRVVSLPVEVDSDRVEASLKDGVLTISLPKAESARPHKIAIRQG